MLNHLKTFNLKIAGYLAFFFFIMVLTFPGAVKANSWRDMNTETEKSGLDTPIHLTVSSLLTYAAYEYSPYKGKRRIAFAMAMPILFALAKELTDENFDIGDVGEYAIAPLCVPLIKITW